MVKSINKMVKSLNKKVKSLNKKDGFTLIDVLVSTFLVLIIFLGIFLAYQLGLKVIGQVRNKVIASAIANGEIEKIRNLPYQSVGVEAAFPDGDLEAIKTVIVNGSEYVVETRVDYVVDEADGISSPEDECPNDYKRAEIKVFWSGKFAGWLKLVTDVSPLSLAQECAESGGILLVQVFDAYGIMVPSPLIEIRDPITDQIIKSASPIEGKYFSSLVPTSYKIVVSKANYSSSRTYGIEEVTNPEKPHPIVLEGELSEISFSIDKLSSMTIEAVGVEELEYPLIPNASFNLRGAKLIGSDVEENPVYKYSQNKITNDLGQITISNLEWDVYTFTPIDLDLDSIESPPGTPIIQPVSLVPDTSQNIRLILEAENSLLIIVQELQTGEPIFSAEVRLRNSDFGYDLTQYTNEEGETYYIPLLSVVYDLEVSASGYNSFSGTIAVSGSMIEVINLTRIE